MAKPVWIQTKATMRARVLVGISWSQGIGLPSEGGDYGVEDPDLWLALGLATRRRISR